MNWLKKLFGKKDQKKTQDRFDFTNVQVGDLLVCEYLYRINITKETFLVKEVTPTHLIMDDPRNTRISKTDGTNDQGFHIQWHL